MARKSPMCFYHVQNEEGESAARPNVYMLPVSPSQRPTLAHVAGAFPLKSTGTFQFRFRVKIGESYGYLDVTDPEEEVPLTAGNVHAKVLRLDSAKCALPAGSGLALKTAASVSAPAVAAPGPAPAPAAPAASSGDLMGSTAPRGGGGAPAGGAGDGSDPDFVFDASEVPPEHRGKSRAVQAAIVKRIRAETAAQAAAVGAVSAGVAAASAHLEEMDGARHIHEAAVRAWGYDTGGELRNIRALLSNLGKILWPEGAGQWKGVSMSALVNPKKVRIPYFKACRIVHPDKNREAPVGQQYIASEVFQALNKAWAVFEEKELGQ